MKKRKLCICVVMRTLQTRIVQTVISDALHTPRHGKLAFKRKTK